jgi:hypothetical protein
VKRNPQGLRVIARNGELVASPSQAPLSNTRVEKNGYIADILVSKYGGGNLFHYVIQRVGSTEIVHWGQEVSFQRAMECVEEFLEAHQAKQA